MEMSSDKNTMLDEELHSAVAVIDSLKSEMRSEVAVHRDQLEEPSAKNAMLSEDLQSTATVIESLKSES